jgi:hypothetical protein
MLVFKLDIQGCSDMKSIALLATALFLASAPSPDSDTIAQISAGFLLPGNVQPLLAAEPGQFINSSVETASEAQLEETPID